MRRPPYDPAVEAAMKRRAAQSLELGGPTLTLETISEFREFHPEVEDLSGFDVSRHDVSIAGYDSAQIELSVFARRGSESVDRPGIFAIHGGGMMLGNRTSGIGTFLAWVMEHDAVAVTVEYRLAPEHPDPVPVEDCYSGWLWTVMHAQGLGIDPGRIIVAGSSAGGGLAAGLSLLARDRGGPAPLGQMLICPMLDDRDASTSTRQYDGIGNWDRGLNRVGWAALLGDRVATANVTPYAAPARAVDLTNLPPTFVDVGSAEVFRDECVDFVSRIWADGGVAELHVWPGGTHGWDVIASDSPMAVQASETRAGWYERLLASHTGLGGPRRA